VFEEMSSAVEARLALIAEGFSGLDDKESIEHVLAALDESLVSLAETYDYTIPAFPPEWRVFETVVAPTYHAGVCDLLTRLSASPNTSNGDLVATVTWSQHYFTAIESLGLAIETTDEEAEDGMDEIDNFSAPRLPYPTGLIKLIETYCGRLRETVTEWMINLCRLANARPPRATADGKLWTPSDVEFFRLVDDQMAIASGTRSDVFVRSCGRVAVALIDAYARAMGERLRIAGHPAATSDTGPLPFETIVAGVNDTRRCRTLVTQTQKTVMDVLEVKDYKLSHAFEQCGQAFNRLNAETRRMISRQVIDDPALDDVFKKLYIGGPDGSWASGDAMSTLLATVEDYLSDVDVWLVDDLAHSVTETLFEHLIELLFVLFTKQTTSVAAHTATRLEADEHALIESMKLRMDHNKALGRIARLQNLRKLVSASGKNDFVHAYEVLLGNWPEAGLDAVEVILRSRRDVDKASRREILEQCRDVYIHKLAAISGSEASVGVSLAGLGKHTVKNHRRTASGISFGRFRDVR
jgi:exocyst complex component 3